MKSKTIAIVSALTFATLGSTAFAQTYVGIGIGASHAGDACAFSEGCKDNAAAGKALVGYAFAGTDFAIEGMYNHLGTFKEHSEVDDANAKIDMFGVGGAWRPQFGAGWGGVVRGGIAYSKVKVDYSQTFLGTPITTTHGSVTDDAWHPYLGLGVTYALTPQVRLVADLDVTRVGARSSTTNVQSLMLGATYGF